MHSKIRYLCTSSSLYDPEVRVSTTSCSLRIRGSILSWDNFCYLIAKFHIFYTDSVAVSIIVTATFFTALRLVQFTVNTNEQISKY